MFCVKCGKEVKEGTKFCTNCGTEMEAKQEVK
ncbi:MAG: zinc-ribbon domain-containing protein, partial [Enterobacteriaceae bacterium]